MSGRKASEVNSLLRNGEKTRCASIDILNSSCKNAKESTDKAKRKKEECETKISNIDFVISDDAKCEFPNLANELEEEVKKLKNEKSATVPMFDSLEYDNLMADYKKNDEFADVVRKNLKRKISSQGRNDPWYCDSEYADAKKVQDNYRKLSQRVSDLNRDSSKIETSSNAYISNLDMRLKRAEKLREEIKLVNPSVVCTKTAENAKILQAEFPDIEVLYGDEGLDAVASDTDNDMILVAVSGKIGLRPTLKAIENKIDIALANKETLVMAGDIVMKKVKESGISLLPVDSEHSAIHQCIKNINEVEKLIITASGGPFRTKTIEEMHHATVEQTLAHPKWNMGKKITIDSATLMNKGLEVIEAHHLFNMPYEKAQELYGYIEKYCAQCG